MSDNEKSGMERLKGRLYARKNNFKSTPRAPLAAHGDEAPVSWGGPPEAPGLSSMHRPAPTSRRKLSFATMFLLGSGVFFLGAMGVAAFIFLGGGNVVSSRNIDLEVLAPSLIDGGKEATLEILITNRNRTPLQLADLIIDYPEGTRDPKDVTETLSHERQSVGTIENGEQLKRTATAVFFGSEGTQQKVKVTLEYTIAGSNAVFVKEDEVDFLIGSSPVSLSVEAPDQVVAGEAFPITVTVQSNAATPVNNVLLEGQYPFGFSVLEASPSAAMGGFLWRLGTMAPGSSKTIRVTGIVEASEGDERVIRFLIGSDGDETATRIAVPFLTQPTTLAVRQPSVTSSLTIDGKTAKNISIAAGRSVPGVVQWKNNLTETLSDVELTLVLEGPMLDSKSVTAENGFYQSSRRTVEWTKAGDPNLAQVSPGTGGSFSFSFATLQPGSEGVVYTNPTINVSLTVRGTRQSQGGQNQTVSSTISSQVTLASNLSLSARALHFEGPFQNSGPIPPEAETPTSYAIVWTVRNSSNAVANASVATVLPPYVKFITAAAGSGITYEEGSRTVRWNLGDVGAGIGYSTPEKQAAFQVMLTPSASQVGQAPALTGTAIFNGQDRFAQVPVSASAEAPTTVLSSDGDYKSGMGEVQSN